MVDGSDGNGSGAFVLVGQENREVVDEKGADGLVREGEKKGTCQICILARPR